MIYVRRTVSPKALDISKASPGSEKLGIMGFDLLVPKKSDFHVEDTYYHSYCVVRDGLDLELLDWCVPR